MEQVISFLDRTFENISTKAVSPLLDWSPLLTHRKVLLPTVLLGIFIVFLVVLVIFIRIRVTRELKKRGLNNEKIFVRKRKGMRKR